MILRKFSALVCALAIVIGASQFVSNDVNAGNNDLALLLPASDGVIVMDSRRLVTDALPEMLSSNMPMLIKINSEIDKLKAKSGLDLREFDSVAVGLKNVGTAGGANEFDTVLLARGNVALGSLSELAKTASKGKYKAIKSGSRTIYVFSPGELIKTKKSGNGSWIESMFSKLFKGLSEEVAITAYDSNTVAFGSLKRVKETIGNNPRISGDLLALLDRKSGSLANGGMIVPAGLSQYLELEDDELGTNLDSIRQVQGAFDVIEGVTSLSIAAKTTETAQAEELAGTLNAIRGMFAGILKKNSDADKQVYGRMLENLAVTQIEREIFIDLSVPKSDLDVLIGKN